MSPHPQQCSQGRHSKPGHRIPPTMQLRQTLYSRSQGPPNSAAKGDTLTHPSCYLDGLGFNPWVWQNILSWRLVMKNILWTFPPHFWFKLGSCQLLAKGCELSTGKLLRSNYLPGNSVVRLTDCFGMSVVIVPRLFEEKQRDIVFGFP